MRIVFLNCFKTLILPIMDTSPLIIEKSLNAPLEKVWKAISDRDTMSLWYFTLAEFKPEVGFEYTFDGGPPEKTYKHLCRVTAAEPNKKLAYTWRYEGYEGDSEVTFELFPEGDKTRLKLTHAGLETFPPVDDFARKNFEMGWGSLIGELLPAFLEKE